MERTELQTLVDTGLETLSRLRTAQAELHRAQETLSFWEGWLSSAERAHQKSCASIQAAGFHDLGHARDVLAHMEDTK